MSCYWQKPMNICSVHLTQNITQSILCYIILQISPISSENLNMQYFFSPNHRNANRTTSTTKSDSSEYRFQLQNFQLQLNPNSCDRLSPWARWLVIDSLKRIWVASCNKLRKYMTQSSIRLLLSGNVQDNQIYIVLGLAGKRGAKGSVQICIWIFNQLPQNSSRSASVDKCHNNKNKHFAVSSSHKANS